MTVISPDVISVFLKKSAMEGSGDTTRIDLCFMSSLARKRSHLLNYSEGLLHHFQTDSIVSRRLDEQPGQQDPLDILPPSLVPRHQKREQWLSLLVIVWKDSDDDDIG